MHTAMPSTVPKNHLEKLNSNFSNPPTHLQGSRQTCNHCYQNMEFKC